MSPLPTALMNNTKWRELFTLLQQHPVYLQLKLLGDADFPLDYERSDWVISNISQRSFTFVALDIEYKKIDTLRICTSTYPARNPESSVGKLMVQLNALGQLPLEEDDEGYLLSGYQR